MCWLVKKLQLQMCLVSANLSPSLPPILYHEFCPMKRKRKTSFSRSKKKNSFSTLLLLLLHQQAGHRLGGHFGGRYGEGVWTGLVLSIRSLWMLSIELNIFVHICLWIWLQLRIKHHRATVPLIIASPYFHTKKGACACDQWQSHSKMKISREHYLKRKYHCMADLLFILFGFSCVAYVALTKVLLFGQI